MQIIGKPTIHPALFYTGKFTGYTAWVLYLGSATGLFTFLPAPIPALRFTAYALTLLAALFITASSVSLGRSTRLGLPTGETALKTHGVYRFSRNPMYVGFNLLTLSSMTYMAHWALLLAGVYSIVVYHLIILGEEKFLVQRFGQAYMEYSRRVRRYL